MKTLFCFLWIGCYNSRSKFRIILNKNNIKNNNNTNNK